MGEFADMYYEQGLNDYLCDSENTKDEEDPYQFYPECDIKHDVYKKLTDLKYCPKCGKPFIEE